MLPGSMNLPCTGINELCSSFDMSCPTGMLPQSAQMLQWVPILNDVVLMAFVCSCLSDARVSVLTACIFARAEDTHLIG